jgi:hypothetical protein
MLTATIAVIASLATQTAPQTYTGRASSITVENGTNRITGIVVADNPACAVEYIYRETWLGDKILIWITCAGEAPCPSYTCAVEEYPAPVQGHTLIWCECVE